MSAALLSASAVLLEPLVRMEVQVPVVSCGAVFSCLAHREATITSSEVTGSGEYARQTVVATMPAALTFGIAGELRGATSGHAFPQSSFLGWAATPHARAVDALRSLRVSKRLTEAVPLPADVADRM
jgi:elongation factor 2